MTRRRIWLLVAGAVIGGVMWGGPTFRGVVVVTLFAATVLLATAVRRRGARRRDLLVRRRSIPATLDLVVLATEAGLTPHQSVELLARAAPPPARPGFDAVLRRVRRGDSLADALVELPRRLGPDVVAAVDAIALAQRHGAPLGDALHVIRAESARQRRAEADAAARRLPILLSFPLVCCVLPAFVLLAIAPAVVAALSSLQTAGW